MRNHILFATLLCVLFFHKTSAQPGFCGAGYSTFYSANIFFTNSLHPTLDGQILPIGSHIIAVFQKDNKWECAGFVQWNGNTVSMVVNGDDINLPGYINNQPYKFIVQLPGGCLIDSVTATYDTSGIYTNPGRFQDGGLSKLSALHTFSHPWITLDASDGLCKNNSASIVATASSLGAPNTFLWSNGDTSATISSLAAGQYTVTVHNTYGCSATAQATITNIVGMAVQLTTEYQSSVAACQSIPSVAGGTAPFTFAWSDGQTGNTATNLSDGDFSVTVTDVNGCTTTQVSNCTVSAVSDIPTLTRFLVSPNPSSGQVQVTAEFLENIEANLLLYNAQGKRLFSESVKGLNMNLNVHLGGYPAGLYFVVLQSGQQKVVEKLVVF